VQSASPGFLLFRRILWREGNSWWGKFTRIALGRFLAVLAIYGTLLVAAQGTPQSGNDFSTYPDAKKLPTETILVEGALSSARDGVTSVQTTDRQGAGEGPAFEVYGAGALSILGNQAKLLAPEAYPQSTGPVIPVPGQPALSPLGRIDSRMEQTQRPLQSILLGGLIAALLTASAFLIWRAYKTQGISRIRIITRPQPRLRPSDILREALRQEISRLEADRRRGLISRKEYTSAKLALKESVKRALASAS
jgi:hypothetical protein